MFFPEPQKLSNTRKSLLIFIQISMLSLCLQSLAFPIAPQNEENNFTPYVWALEYGVSELKRATEFYAQALGFEIEPNDCCAPARVLRNGAVRLLLNRVEAEMPATGAANAHLNMRVGDLPVALEAVRKHGGKIENESPQDFALGKFVAIHDPFGNAINLLDVANDDKTAESKPAVFNIGVVGEKLEEEEAFFAALGFQIYSRDYLPDLPLQRHGVVALVLHGGAQEQAKFNRRNGTIVLGTTDLKAAVQTLKSRGVKIALPSPAKFALFKDPSGNPLKLLQLDAARFAAKNETNGSVKNPPQLAPAGAGFELFKKLAGKWKGRSTKGWEEAITFKTIAKGSVVVENSFDAHPNETMMTMFYLDGEQLLLTHYCVAGSQPRLKATSFEDEGKTITFTFLDATNLKSRDQGHMDKALFRFLDDDHFTTQWTWYQNGKENWMEEIQMERQ